MGLLTETLRSHNIVWYALESASSVIKHYTHDGTKLNLRILIDQITLDWMTSKVLQLNDLISAP